MTFSLILIINNFLICLKEFYFKDLLENVFDSKIIEVFLCNLLYKKQFLKIIYLKKVIK